MAYFEVYDADTATRLANRFSTLARAQRFAEDHKARNGRDLIVTQCQQVWATRMLTPADFGATPDA